MGKHRLDQAEGKNHTEMKQIVSIIALCRVDGKTGVWAMTKGMWESERRRGIQTSQQA